MKTYACSDLHGCLSFYTAIKEALEPEDRVYFLGDAGDRGPESWETLNAILNDPQFIFIKGNHEDMMYESFHEIGPDRGEMLKHWTKGGNGGQETLDNIKSLNLDYDTKMEYINTIARLPHYAEYENADGIKFILCHAGYTPGKSWDEIDPWKKEEKMLWNRNHFVNPNSWPVDESIYDNVVMVHGHTPILLMKQWGFNASGLAPFWYDGNHKVNVDAATANTGLAFLLNLDNYDYELFADGSVYKYTEEEE
jgi:diadenosine tetraphosphatase ApaH/serine/threonine PP2A family protein phosphatase